MLDGAVRPVEGRGDLANAPAVDEPHLDHLALQVGKALDDLKEHRPPLDVLGFPAVGKIRRRPGRVALGLPPAIGQRVGGNAIQPRYERRPAPRTAGDWSGAFEDTEYVLRPARLFARRPIGGTRWKLPYRSTNVRAACARTFVVTACIATTPVDQSNGLAGLKVMGAARHP